MQEALEQMPDIEERMILAWNKKQSARKQTEETIGQAKHKDAKKGSVEPLFTVDKDSPPRDLGSSDILEQVTKLREFCQKYYVGINEINRDTGKPQTFEQHLRAVIEIVRDDLRRGNYLNKKSQIEFLADLENKLRMWQEMPESDKRYVLNVCP